MFNLAEDLYLLALQDDKGSLAGMVSMFANYMAAGAVLIDLNLQGRIHLENDQVKVANPAPLGDPVLDRALEMMAQSKTSLPPAKWVQQFSKLYKELHGLMTARLIKNRVIKRVDKRILGIFPVQRYPLRRKKYKRELLRGVRSAILRNRAPDERMMGMIRLIYVTGLVNVIFQRDERRKAKEKIMELLKAESLSTDMDQADNTIAKAVERSINVKKIQHAVMHSGG